MKKAALLMIASVAFASGCEKILERNKEADDLCEKVLSMFAAGEAQKIYDELGAKELREQVSPEKWREVGTKLQVLGKPKEFRRTSFSQKTSDGVTTGEFKYRVTWSGGEGDFILKTKIENNKWTVLGAHFKAD